MLNFTSLLALGCALAFTACTSPKGPAQTPAKREMKPDGGVTQQTTVSTPPPAVIKTPEKKAPLDPHTPAPGIESSEACADCHPDIVEGFRKTGMGNSLYRPNTRPPIENFDAKAATVTHPKSGLTYRAYIDKAGRWWQEETLPGTDHLRRVEVTHIIGSGNHTRSYLGKVDGQVVQLPLTWYSGRKIWDMSPGYDIEQHFRFDRPAKAICLFCHNNLTPMDPKRVAGYLTPLAEGISCNRCHGDGRAHIEARSAGKSPPAGQPDPTILNPAHLSTKRQLQVCQQCHLSGEARLLKAGQSWDEYTPRTPLDEYMSIYTLADDTSPEFSITSHGYRLGLSRCSTESKGQLTCTTCHDPHRRDKARETTGSCQSCHQPDDCGEAHQVTAGQSCASCHMHRGGTSDIPHVSFTDHYIRKRPKKSSAQSKAKVTNLVDALASDGAVDDSPLARTRLGIAHAQMWRVDGKAPHRALGKSQLSAALKETTDHEQGWQELALLHKSEGNLEAALAAFARAAQLPGGRAHRHRVDEAETLEQIGQVAAAAEVLSQVIEQDPNNRVAWGNLANALLRLGRLDDAEKAYARADELAPSVALTASNRGYLELQRGRLDAAERWFKEAMRRDGTKAMMYANLGTLALARKDFKTAKRYYTDALARDPKFGIAYWMLARLAAQDGKSQEAKSHLRMMIKVAPKDVRGPIDLADLLRKEGAVREAKVVLLTALQVQAQHPALLAALRRVQAIPGQAP